MPLSSESITSDKQYLKIIADGATTISAASAPDADSTFPADPFGPVLSNSQTVAHTAAAVPIVRAFWDPAKNGHWYSVYLNYVPTPLDPWLKYIATTASVKLIMNTGGATKSNIPVFYRIYSPGDTNVTTESRYDKIFSVVPTANAVAAAAAFSDTPVLTTITIPHGAGEVPIWTLEFSEDGATWFPEGVKNIGPADTTTGPPGGPYNYYFGTTAYGHADSTNFYVTLVNNYLSTKTIYYRYALDYRT